MPPREAMPSGIRAAAAALEGLVADTAVGHPLPAAHIPVAAQAIAPPLEGLPLAVVLATVVGLLAATALRRHALHWSWAAGALLLVLLVGRSLPGAGVAAPALALAAVLARARHRRELEAGEDLAARARARRTVADGALGLWERIGGRRSDGDLLLGVDDRGRAVSIASPARQTGHTLVLGATGAGKTVTQARIASAAILSGAGAIVLDPKGDEHLRASVGATAAASGRELLEWTPGGPCVYNPFARGSDTEVADKLLAGEPFSEPHYLRQAQRYIGHAVRALRAAGREVCLREVVQSLDPSALEELLRTVPDTASASTYLYLDSLTTRQRSDLSGVRDRLAIMAESDAGPWLDPAGCPARRIDLLRVLQEREVAYFAIEADARPLLARMLAAAIVADLSAAVAALQGCPTRAVVVVDEFSALAADQVSRLFGRARSAGVSLLLGTQELADLRLPGGERLLDQVLGNLSAVIAHRQAVPASAQLVAEMAGTRGAWRTSRSSNGHATRTRVREQVLDASQVMRLEPGRAAVIPLAAPGAPRITRVLHDGGRR